MKLIIIKIFEINTNYKIGINYLRINNKNKIIDKTETIKFCNLDDVKNYFLDVNIIYEYKNAKILVDYISPKIILENINSDNNNIKLNKNSLKDKINELYPNFELSYEYKVDNYLNNKQKYYLITLINQKLQDEINQKLKFFGGKKTYLYFDQLLNNNYLNYIKNDLVKKHILYFIVEQKIYRIMDIVNGKVINFTYLNEEDTDFEECKKIIFNRIDKRYDKIIIESDFKTYIIIAEILDGYDIIYYEYADKLKYFDERKLLYAS